MKLYGLERGSAEGFAWQCLVARRLAERGVRFIELIDTGSSNNWDAHGNLKGYDKLARNIDQPIAGLLKDLKSRGLLDDTLVVWTTEYGRTPWVDQPDGRGHHNFVFSSWMAGGASNRASSMASRMSTAIRWPKTKSTSTTSTRRSCICSASITRG